MRPATENDASIDALRIAVLRNEAEFKENSLKKLSNLAYLRKRVEKEIADTIIVSPENSPHILMLAVKGVRGEVLMHSLEKHNIYIGIGSACSSKKGNRFQTLLGLDSTHKEGVIRISLSEYNTLDELDILIEAIKTEAGFVAKI